MVYLHKGVVAVVPYWLWGIVPPPEIIAELNTFVFGPIFIKVGVTCKWLGYIEAGAFPMMRNSPTGMTHIMKRFLVLNTRSELLHPFLSYKEIIRSYFSAQCHLNF